MIFEEMADRYGMHEQAFIAVVKAACFAGMKPEQLPSDAELAAFLLIAKQYDLNPITREIFGFRRKGGGLQTVVSIDGWMALINRQPNMNGLEFVDQIDGKGELTAVTARIYRRDRDHPTEVTEYMAECRSTADDSPWKRWPRRMLRHKAAIQCARYAFGLVGIVDPDEAERGDYEPAQRKISAPSPDEQRRTLEHKPQEREPIDAGKPQEREAVLAGTEGQSEPEASQRASLSQEEAKPKTEFYSKGQKQEAVIENNVIEDKPASVKTATTKIGEAGYVPLSGRARRPEPDDDSTLREAQRRSPSVKAGPAPEPFDAWKWLDDLNARFIACKTAEDVAGVWDDALSRRDDVQYPSDWQEAEKLHETAKVRIDG